MQEAKYPIPREKNEATIYHENFEEMLYGAPHHFVLADRTGTAIACVDFQEGPVKSQGINGVTNEDLVQMILIRLTRWQNTEFKCTENEMAIERLTEALLWLNKRTKKRQARGVEGTTNV